MAANAVSRRAAALNLGNGERAGALIGGTVLILRALSRPSLGRVAAAVGGAVLLQWGSADIGRFTGLSGTIAAPVVWRVKIRCC
jgi:hypothetical protein